MKEDGDIDLAVLVLSLHPGRAGIWRDWRATNKFR